MRGSSNLKELFSIWQQPFTISTSRLKRLLFRCTNLPSRLYKEASIRSSRAAESFGRPRGKMGEMRPPTSEASTKLTRAHHLDWLEMHLRAFLAVKMLKIFSNEAP